LKTFLPSLLGLLPALLAAPACALPAERLIAIQDSQVLPENLSAAPDGTLYIGSWGKGGIYRAAPGAEVATLWIAPERDGLGAVLGVLVDTPRALLWVCMGGARATADKPAVPGAIRALDLATGATKAHYAIDGGARCNDMTIAPDGTVYATDFDNGRVLRLVKGDTLFRAWASDPLLATADGLALLDDGQLYVNTYRTNKLLRVAIKADGSAGAVTELTLDKPITQPDGMRSTGRTLLVAEGGGRVSEIGIQGDRGTVRVLRDGIPDDPTSVVRAGDALYVSQGRWAARTDPALDTKPYTVLVVPYPD